MHWVLWETVCLMQGHVIKKGLAQGSGVSLPLCIEFPLALSLPAQGEILPGQAVLPKYGIIQCIVVLVLRG